MNHILTLPPQADLNLLSGDYLQLNITSAGAFCTSANSATFNPALPNGYLPVGIWPNPAHFPNGTHATGLGRCDYTFTAGTQICAGETRDVPGKVIHVNSSNPHDKHE